MLPKEAEGRAEISAALRPQFEEPAGCSSSHSASFPNLASREKTGPEVDRVVALVAVGLLVNAIKTFRAIPLTSEAGLWQDAMDTDARHV